MKKTLNEPHPLTLYFFRTYFLLSSVPSWYRRRKEVINDISHLHSIKQGVSYDHYPVSQYKQFRYRISRKFKIAYTHIDLLLGVCCLDLSEPYGVLRDFFLMSEPQIKRSRIAKVLNEDE